jgi:hypothetical protein
MLISKGKKLTDLSQVFLEPRNSTHRQYEALRGFFVEGLSSAEVARRFGYTPGSFRVLAHQFRQEPLRVTAQELRAAFDQEDGAIQRSRAAVGRMGAYPFCARHASYSRGEGLAQGRGVAPCARSVLERGRGRRRTSSWLATAESVATGCGAGRDRMTSLHSRGSQVSRWRHWIRAWGSDEPVANEPAA